MRRSSTLIRALWAAGAFASPACADQPVTESAFFADVPVVLSASRLSQPVADAPAAVTVITQAEIQASGFRDIPDLLRLVPGFSVADSGLNTWAVGYHGFADAFSRRYQVLVDGRSIYSSNFGEVNWNDLPLSIEDIDRIEVVRGPNAAAYGSNAFFAVINIITKSAGQTPGFYSSVQYGTHGMGGVMLRQGGSLGPALYRITVSAQKRQRLNSVGYDNSGKPVYPDETTKTYFTNGRLDWQVNNTDDVMAQFGLTTGNWTFSPSGYSSPENVYAGFLQLKYHRILSTDDEWYVQFYYTRDRFDTALAFPPFGLPVYILQSRTNLDAQMSHRLSPTLRAVWGAEVRQETDSSPAYFSTASTFSGVLTRGYLNLEWRPAERWVLQGEAMVEHHYFTGTDVSPRVAANYTFAPGQTLRFAVSVADRTPTFHEENNYYISSNNGQPVLNIPNPRLKPERLLSREIGYVAQFPQVGLDMDARMFYDTFHNYIAALDVPLPAPMSFPGLGAVTQGGQYQNTGTIDIHGAELEAHWRPHADVDVWATAARVFAYPDAQVNAADPDVAVSAPRTTGSLLASYRFGNGWQASVGTYFNGTMKWLSDGDWTKSYTRVDARLARRFRWAGHDAEAALVAQSLTGSYSEFRREYVFGGRYYGSLSVHW